MARKGIRRTHTGCVTCKIRRVKCDEAHPHCLNCTSTGRRCDGYQPWVPRAQRVRPSIIPGATELDLRSLGYFHQIIAPRNIPFHPDFWNRLLPQWLHQESAVRHAVVAISSLTEQANQQSLINQDFAVGRYNAAIKDITMPNLRAPDLDTVILTSILFMSIEFMRGNLKGSLVHYQHCKKILKGHRTIPHLARLFRQCEILSLFFYETHYHPSSNTNSPTTGNFRTIDEAQNALDWLTYRTMKVPFAIDNTTATSSLSPSVLLQIRSMQQALNQDLSAMTQSIMELKSQYSPSSQWASHQILMLEARCLACEIWTNLGTSGSEAHAYYIKARRIFEILTVVYGMTLFPRRVDRVNDYGLPEILHIVLMGSRNLKLRLTTLNIFRERYCLDGGTLDIRRLYFTATQAIQDDHGITLGSEWTIPNGAPVSLDVASPLQPVLSPSQSLCPWILVVIAIRERAQQVRLT